MYVITKKNNYQVDNKVYFESTLADAQKLVKFILDREEAGDLPSNKTGYEWIIAKVID